MLFSLSDVARSTVSSDGERDLCDLKVEAGYGYLTTLSEYLYSSCSASSRTSELSHALRHLCVRAFVKASPII